MPEIEANRTLLTHPHDGHQPGDECLGCRTVTWEETIGVIRSMPIEQFRDELRKRRDRLIVSGS